MSKKLTKIEMFGQILAHTVDKAEQEFLKNEILVLRNKQENKKPTAEQKENAELKVEILAVLDDGQPKTVSQVWRAKEEWVLKWSIQKFSALLNQLADAKLVVKTSVKRVTYFAKVMTEVEDVAEEVTED